MGERPSEPAQDRGLGLAAHELPPASEGGGAVPPSPAIVQRDGPESPVSQEPALCSSQLMYEDRKGGERVLERVLGGRFLKLLPSGVWREPLVHL